MSSLTDDYYEFIEDRYCLTGTHTGNTYRLGDTVQIESAAGEHGRPQY